MPLTEIRIETLVLPGSPVGAENPLPFFRDAVENMPVQALDSLPEDKRRHLGWQTGFRILPYRMQDGYTRGRQPVSLRSIVLENEYLRAVFLPEVGGRLYSLIWKPLERELLHRNPVFQPANLAIRNAWFSGGIEWNIGQFGHTFTTCSPVFAAQIRGAAGEPGLRIYEYERCKGLFWQVDFYLPPGLPFLLAYTRVVNPKADETSMYWWTNIAVDEGKDVRVLASASKAIYLGMESGQFAFGLTELPGLPSLNGADGTYALNSTFANEFFFQCDQTDMPWEAALDGRGSGLVEASTPRLRYRKLFVWGSHPGGRHWQEFLAEPGQAYLEIQAGLAPTQVHGLPMPGRSVWDWTQAFGYLEADPAAVHSPDWETARQSADAALKARLTPQRLAQLEENCRSRAGAAPEALIQAGAGWGALEVKRAGGAPDGLDFPAAGLGAEQEKWLALLRHGALPEQDPGSLPGEWLVQPEWEALLAASPHKNWLAWLHLGVMRMERFDESGAEAAWRESIRLAPSPWAYRDLAVLSLRRGDAERALEEYEQAWRLAAGQAEMPVGLAVEYLRILQATGLAEAGMGIYCSLPANVQSAARVQILRGQFALALNDLEAVEDVLSREYAEVREGETTLSDLWFEMHARREAERSGRTLDESLRREVRLACPPPSRIDFRSFNEA
jgi:hypothetical protein